MSNDVSLDELKLELKSEKREKNRLQRELRARDEVISSYKRSAAFQENLGNIILEQKKEQDSLRKMLELSEYNRNILQAINLASSYLLHSNPDTFNSDLHKAFQVLGYATKVDRVYIWKNHIEDDDLCCTQIFEWSEGAAPQQGNELTVSISYKEVVPYWGELLSQNKAINSFVCDLPKGEKEHLEEQGVLSVLAVPIFIEEQFWGFIGFDECKSERIFIEEEEAILRSCGMLFAHACSQNETLKDVANAEERVQLMFDATPLAVTLWNRDLQILDCNKDTVETFGYESKQDFIDRFYGNMPEKQPDGSNSSEKIVKEITKAFDEGYNRLRWVHKTADGQLLPLDAKLVRIKLRDDFAVVIYARDLREQERMEAESKKLAEAEAANRAKSDFLATMSHEIRTPMNAIIGIAQIQLQKGDLPEKYASELNKIYNSGCNLLGLINDILDMSKIETGKMELNPVNYDLPSLIYDASQVNIIRIGSKPINFIVDADKNLPLKMIGDELRLKQILNNLLSNAIKYTDSGHVKLSVSHIFPDSPGHLELDLESCEIADQARNDILLKFIVEDTGQGMKPDDLEKLFAEYTRFNLEANKATEGTGIGLSITQNLVSLMDGTIEVESEYGKGSIFTVVVKQELVECEPIGEELSERLRNFTFSGEKQTSLLQFKRDLMPYGTVLIVDDVETNLYVSEGLISPYGIKIETVTSGYDAIEKVESGKVYDIIFMDHMMPLMDGIETTQKLRAMGYKDAIVALTANALVSNAEMFRQNGFDGFIAKPIDLRELNNVLNKFIRDKYPEEAKKSVGTTAQIVHGQPGATIPASVNPKLRDVFYRDAKKAVTTLRETAVEKNIKLMITTVHAMKSALANIGEKEMSDIAADLENAGLKNNTEFISGNLESFVEKLEALADTLKPDEVISSNEEYIQEDTAYLNEQLTKIIAACEEYDDNTIFDILDMLTEKQWKSDTSAVLDRIRDMLFLHSDFDGVILEAEKCLTSDRDTIAFIGNIDGLDIDTAVSTMGGLTDVYTNAIKLTTRLLPETLDKLDNYVQSGDIKAFAVEIHGLKGVFNNIGAYTLGQKADLLESEALKDKLCCQTYDRFKISAIELYEKMSDALPEEEEKKEDLPPVYSELAKIAEEVRIAAEGFDSVLALEKIKILEGIIHANAR